MSVPLDRRMVYAPMHLRPTVTWPDGKGVAVWLAPNVEHYDFVAPERYRVPDRVHSPDVQHFTHRDYGNRVGFWRMLEVIDEFDVPCTVSLSLSMLEEYSAIRDAMLERDWEVMSHGFYNTRPLYGLDGEEESSFYRASQEMAVRHTGSPLKGMLGPKISGTDSSCDLMAEYGFQYQADWIHDEQPRPLRTASGRRLVSVPYSFMLNDVPLLHARQFSGAFFERLVREQVTRLLDDHERDGQARMTCVAIHPYLMGQPYMRAHFVSILRFLRSDSRIWLTTAANAVQHFMTEHFQAQLDFADELAAGFEVMA
jgi:peptidoglycan/xylan/chitin deacetylase (PgdA/CDA1 family)